MWRSRAVHVITFSGIPGNLIQGEYLDILLVMGWGGLGLDYKRRGAKIFERDFVTHGWFLPNSKH